MAVGARQAEHLARVVGRRHRDGRRSARPQRQLARRRRLHLRDVAAFAATRTFSSACGGWRPDATDLGGDTTAYGFKVDYPNDQWDIALTYKRIGRDFDPSLGFVPRRAVHLFERASSTTARACRAAVQQMFYEFGPSLATDLSGRWESYRVLRRAGQLALPQRRSRSSSTSNPTGERLVEPFEIADGVVIPPGTYHWRRYRLEVGTAQKRRLYAQLTWWFGGFYDGELDQLESTAAWNPTPLVTVELTGERNVGRLPSGRFTQTLVGRRVRVNVSPDLSLPATSSTTPTATRSASTRGCAGRSARRRSLRRLQPQRAIAARSLAARLEPAAGQAAVRVADVAGFGVGLDRRPRLLY